MTHHIGIDACLQIARTGEGSGASGWYPFFDITTEICPFINHFWDQLAPLNMGMSYSNHFSFFLLPSLFPHYFCLPASSLLKNSYFII
jgi:hypothetical protein